MERGKRGGVNVVFANVQSVVNKVNKVRAIASINNCDILALTETWANKEIGNNLLYIDGYEMVARMDRKDTDRGRGGGILVYAKPEIDVWTLDANTNFHQCVTLEVKQGSQEVNIHVVYRSPNSKKANDDDLCRYIAEMKGPNLLMGDFNFPDVDWASGTAGSKGREFYEATTEAFFEQYVTEPTHASGNILDLVLCNRDGMVSEVKTDGRIGKSDHDMVSFKMHIKKAEELDKRLFYNYSKADFKAMREAIIKTDWEEEWKDRVVNEIWNSLKNTILNLMAKHIPKKSRKKRNDPKWMDNNVRTILRDKKSAWKRWKQTKKESDRAEYKKMVSKAKKAIRKTRWRKK